MKTATRFRCDDCGAVASKWAGRCSACGSWNSLVEELADERPREPPLPASQPPVPLAEIDVDGWTAEPTGISEVDRVLGGGLVPGSVTLVGGEPGVGKSTLVLQLASALAGASRRVLYVSGEESVQQIRLRAERLDALPSNLLVGAETSLPAVLAHVQQVEPDAVVVDSIQTLADPAFQSAAGSVTQVRECAHRIVREAKERRFAALLVGQVTKDGGLAGPRVLEHVVDTVLGFEGDAHHGLRLLRATKHRFGATNELGLFEMTGSGLASVPDPSRLFLTDRRTGIAGSVVAPVLEGRRPLLVEVQALVGRSELAMPRRSVQGLESGRLAPLLAVLGSHAGVSMANHDVYVSVAGGVRVTEPATDLAVALAVTSSVTGVAVPSGTVACGEVGLGGEIRQIRDLPHRLAEAARLGFTEAIVPTSVDAGPAGVRLRRASTIADAVALVT